MKKNEIIFDLTNTNYKYKGVLFANVDNSEVDKEDGMKHFPPTPKWFIAGIMTLIWVDEKGIWNAKTRIKFPSGNKQVFEKIYDEEFKSGINVNETFVLNELYKLPMTNKSWLKNIDETPEGIVKLIADADMIESLRIENV